MIWLVLAMAAYPVMFALGVRSERRRQRDGKAL